MRNGRSHTAKGCSIPDAQLVERMSPFLPSRTDKAMGARFGISYWTWRKLVEGRPVRSSLICRLEVRIAQLEGDQQRFNPH